MRILTKWTKVETVDPPLLINIRGCNGAGKSTVPMAMMGAEDMFLLSWIIEGKEKPFATVFPKYNCIAMGTYFNKTGGLDTYRNNDSTRKALELLWNTPYNIIMEGVIASTIKSTYAELFKNFSDRDDLKEREIIIASLLPPVQVCLDRVQSRNGGKEVKNDQIESKWRTVKRNVAYFKEEGFTSLELDNSVISKEDTLIWFFRAIGHEMITNPTHPKIIENSPKKQSTGVTYKLYLPTKEEIEGHEWSKFYKEPDDSVVVDWDNMRLYWYWIAERQKIWYKRTVLQQPAPWTEDPILQKWKFTNCIRDLDRGTIIYINEILKKLDEPCEDIVKRKKEVILNTMIYRLFIRYETWSTFKFLYLDTWDEQWESAKKSLRAIKASGNPVFHGSYYVNDLKSANPNPNTSSDKTENAICLCEKFYERIDETYEFITKHNMKDCLEFFQTFPAIGHFTAYEWACDFAMSHRHTENELVPWDDDSYVNVGPGNHKGLEFVFKNGGNLSDFQKDIYLRATWRHYMKEYGFYDEFISQLPDFMNGDINLRVIEHSSCENQKYLNTLYETGRCKASFTPVTKDANTLVL